MSREIGVPPLPLAEKLPRAGFTRDGGGPLLNIIFDEPLVAISPGIFEDRTELTGCQERIAADHEVPITYEVRRPTYQDDGTRPLKTYLGIRPIEPAYQAKIADVRTSPRMDAQQRKGLRKMERVGGMLLGIFVDRPVRDSNKTIKRDPEYLYTGTTPDDTEIHRKTVVTEHRHVRRGVQVGIGLPRFLDRRRSILGLTDKGISNRGWAIVLSALAGGTLATPWVQLPEGTTEKIENAVEDVSGGHLDMGVIVANTPNIRIPIPDIDVDLAAETVTIDRDSRQIKEQGAPTVIHTTEVLPGDTPEATVKLTQFGLGNFEGYVGQYDLTELENVLEGLNLEDISVINISASASDESQQDIASGTCGIGKPNTENEQLAQQRADEITSYLISRGIKPENIQTLDIGEKVISEKLTELDALVSANNLTIQQACERYNTGQQDTLPAALRSFFDTELASNRYAIVDFYTGEERPATIIENISSCTMDTEITEYVNEQTISTGFPFSVDMDGNGLDLKGNSFGIPTILLTAWGVLVFGQVSRRQRTISKLETVRSEVLLVDDKYLPYTPTPPTEPLAPTPRIGLRDVLVPSGCAVPSWKWAIPFVALLGLALVANQCGSDDNSARRYAPMTGLTKTPVDQVPCEETIQITRVGSGLQAGEIFGTSTTTKIVSVPEGAIRTIDQ